jgi:hypothetical protein
MVYVRVHSVPKNSTVIWIAKKTLDKATKIYEDSSVCYGLSV